MSENILTDPRYAENPSYFFFELFVMDTIEPLPLEHATWIANTIESDLEQWRAKTKTILRLSDTIEIAILDLWFRNSEIAAAQEIDYPSRQFAIDFVDHYSAPDSRVDVWEPGAIEDAQERIRVAMGRRSRVQ